MKHIVVVGSGFSGSILARKIAEKLGYPVTLVEKRRHIAGNMYDEYDSHGILVQKYGPHFLNSNHYEVMQFLMQYAELFPHCTKMLSFIDGRHVRLPFNFETVQQLIGPEKAEGLLAKLRKAFAGRDRVPVLELVDHSDPDISGYGHLLFEKAYRTYTSKMWDVPPEKIDPYVLERVPMAMGYDERYLNKDFQYLPVKGYTEMFRNMLDHPLIDLRMETDALEGLELDKDTRTIRYEGRPVDCLVYTGAIDELFGCKYGMLPYRSLDIRYEYYPQDSVLPIEIVSFPQAPGYTRSTEYRKIMYSDTGVEGTVVATEYPMAYEPQAEVGNIPCYPVVTEESLSIYKKYRTEATEYEGLFLCGRLAEFRYYNMDICIEHALAYFEDIRAYLMKDHD